MVFFQNEFYEYMEDYMHQEDLVFVTFLGCYSSKVEKINIFGDFFFFGFLVQSSGLII